MPREKGRTMKSPDAQRMPRWISVEERLPECNVKVLLLHPHVCAWDNHEDTIERIVTTGELIVPPGFKRKKAWAVHEKKYDIGVIYEMGYATHWMPLPEPPEA